MVRIDSRQPHPLWKHGGAGQVLPGRHQRTLDIRRPGGQARRRFYLDPNTSWRPGVDVAVHDGAAAPPRHVLGGPAIHGGRPHGHSQRRDALWRESCGRSDSTRRTVRARECLGSRIGNARRGARGSARNARMNAAASLTIWLWLALTLSLLAWILVGYPWPICVIAVLPLLAPLRGLLRGSRYTYAWATLYAIPYLAFAVTELLVNPQARWVAAMSLLLVFAWFCTMILFLRASRVHRE